MENDKEKINKKLKIESSNQEMMDTFNEDYLIILQQEQLEQGNQINKENQQNDENQDQITQLKKESKQKKDHFKTIQENNQKTIQYIYDGEKVKYEVYKEDIKGSGGFSVIQKVIDLKNKDRDLVLKLVEKPKTEQGIENYEREMEINDILREKPHENVCAAIEVQNTGDFNTSYLIMEYYEVGDFIDFITKGLYQEQTNYEKIQNMIEICLGLKHIHSLNILHRDLKLENVFVKPIKEKNNFQMKIGDFGFSKIEEQIFIEKNLSRPVGTSYFNSIESLDKKPIYFQKSEIWSLGIILFRLFSQNFEQPFNGQEDDSNETQFLHIDKILSQINNPLKGQIICQINQGFLNPFKQNNEKKKIISQLILELINSIFKKNPSLRPNIDQIIIQLKEIQHFFSENNE